MNAIKKITIISVSNIILIEKLKRKFYKNSSLNLVKQMLIIEINYFLKMDIQKNAL